MMLRRQKARSGTVLAEAALIYPVLFLLILGVILLGISVFRYQQVSHISREASRWASVHGATYAKENNTTAASPQDICDKAITPFASGMSTQGMTYTTSTNTTAGTITYTGVSADGRVTFAVTWNTDAQGNPDKRPTRVVTQLDATGQKEDVAQYNTVKVTVTYTWNTGLFGVIPVSSTSVNTIFY